MTTEYKQSLYHALHRDLKAANLFLKVCRQHIGQAVADNDHDTVHFWARQMDSTLEQIQLLRWQLRQV